MTFYKWFKLFFKMSHALKNVRVILLYVQTFVVKCVFARLWKHTCLGCMRVKDCAMIHAWSVEGKSGNSTENFTPFQTSFSFMLGSMKGETTMFSPSCVLGWYPEWPLIFYSHLFHLSKNNTHTNLSSCHQRKGLYQICPAQQYVHV